MRHVPSVGNARSAPLRVIAGTYRSRVLQAPRGMATRPTSDRLRETLFNVLQPRMAECRFLDLYAGSGAVGIEALSRGAGSVVFVEKARSALDAIRANLRSLGVTAGVEIESGGVATLLKRKSAPNAAADIVFLDPPYEDAEAYSSTLHALGDAAACMLQSDGIVVAEHARKLPLLERYGALRRTRELVQGDATLSFYILEQDQSRWPE